MKKQWFFIVLGVSILFLATSGCTGGKGKKTEATGPEFDTLTVPVGDSYYLQAYVAPFCYSTTAEIDGKDYLIGYNEKIHAVDFIDLTDKKPARRVQLQKDGPEGVQALWGLDYYRGDVFIETMTGYFLVDSAGQIKKKISKSEITDGFPDYRIWKPNMILWMMYKFVFFDRENGIFAVPLYPADLNAQIPSSPLLIVRVSLADGKVIDRIEAPYPEALKKRAKWGALNDLNICMHGNELLFNYAASSDVYRCDLSSGEITRMEMPSQYTDNVFMPQEEASLDVNQASVNAGYYFPLQYDPYRNVYWRLHLGNTARRAAYMDRPYVVTEISSDLKKIREIEIPASGLNLYTNLLISRNGVLLPYYYGLDENSLNLFRIPVE